MGKLSYKERKDLPKKDFAEKKSRSYPINDESHARNALSRANEYGSSSEKATVRSAVRKKYPGIMEKALEKKK